MTEVQSASQPNSVSKSLNPYFYAALEAQPNMVGNLISANELQKNGAANFPAVQQTEVKPKRKNPLVAGVKWIFDFFKKTVSEPRTKKTVLNFVSAPTVFTTPQRAELAKIINNPFFDIETRKQSALEYKDLIGVSCVSGSFADLPICIYNDAAKDGIKIAFNAEGTPSNTMRAPQFNRTLTIADPITDAKPDSPRNIITHAAQKDFPQDALRKEIALYLRNRANESEDTKLNSPPQFREDLEEAYVGLLAAASRNEPLKNFKVNMSEIAKTDGIDLTVHGVTLFFDVVMPLAGGGEQIA